MKKLLYIMAAVAMTLTACNKETDTTEQGTKGTPLAIDVAVVSPTSPANTANTASPTNPVSPSTRATDTGYDTAFGVGDAIGIWLYEGATEIYTNKKWERQANGTWKPATATDGIYYNGTSITIKAYFPYVTGLSALPTAATFTVQADQSTLANYRASDLLLSTDQTWSGTVATLPLSFAHAMAMVEAVPSSTAALQSVTMSAKTSDGAAAATALTLYKFGTDTYRALLPAQTLATSLYFNYTTESYAYSATTTLAGGSYYKYGVTTLPAAVGDYYYNDGSYSPTYPVAGKTCVGIVFRAKTAIQTGLVVALNAALATLKWGPPGTDTGATDMNNGAANMDKIKGIANWETDYPAFAYCASYGSGTAFAGQWYLPAKNELQAIYNNKGIINNKLTAASTTSLNNSYYWSSSEYYATDAWYVYFDSGFSYGNYKGNNYTYRAVLAF